MHHYADTVTAFRKPKVNFASEVISKVPFSSTSTTGDFVPAAVTSPSKARRRLPLKSERSDDSLPVISPRLSPDETSDGSYSPMNMSRPLSASQRLQPMKDSAPSTSTSLTPPALRMSGTVKSARIDLAPMHDHADFTVECGAGAAGDFSPASTKSLTPPPPPLKSCLKSVRKKFQRQLSRMNSR